MQPITPFLWFDTQAEEAAQFYTSIFKNSKILNVSRYTEAGKEIHGKEPGSAMVVEFELNGQKFQAINGGPHFTFTPAISFLVTCEDQEEVDHYWDKLTAGGAPEAQQCGWLADKYGLSWQIVPKQLFDFMSDPDRTKAGRAMEAMMHMKKLDIAALQKAHDGE
ncbi:MAG: hypothetical protein QG621_285 [Patescibacteria group bacterium]|jgi:predicted 3-demethylubiquinone-9 3-methyltransferase (glyoxalase superfamily)|nr:hypothetical protein [Patescibacteria group bacterium]